MKYAKTQISILASILTLVISVLGILPTPKAYAAANGTCFVTTNGAASQAACSTKEAEFGRAAVDSGPRGACYNLAISSAGGSGTARVDGTNCNGETGGTCFVTTNGAASKDRCSNKASSFRLSASRAASNSLCYGISVSASGASSATRVFQANCGNGSATTPQATAPTGSTNPPPVSPDNVTEGNAGSDATGTTVAPECDPQTGLLKNPSASQSTVCSPNNCDQRILNPDGSVKECLQCNVTDTATSNSCNLFRYINLAISFASALIGIIVTVLIIVGGIEYMTAGADPNKVAKAKGRIGKGIGALVAFGLLYAILQYVTPGGIF